MAENPNGGTTSANNLDEGISRLDKTLSKIYLPEIMAARRVIHSRMRRKRELINAGPSTKGPTLYDYIIASRRSKVGGTPQLSEETLEEEPEYEEKREHNPPTRQDSVFQSVDLSEIAGLREDPNRTPTPQPTFTDGPVNQRRQSNKVMAATVLSSVGEQNKVNSTSSSGRSSVKSDEVIHESYELQVKPGYADARQVEMATQAASARGQLQKSNSFHEDRRTDGLGARQDSTASDPGEVKEKSVKKKQQMRQANDLDLAQKIILKRKVEEYIERQEPEVTIEEEYVTIQRDTAWEKNVRQSVNEEVLTARDVVIKTSETDHVKTGRDSVQSVVSHKSDSSTESSVTNAKHETFKQETEENVTIQSGSENVSRAPVVNSAATASDRPESNSPQLRSSSSASDLNPHPLIPAIGASVNTNNEQNEEDDVEEEEEEEEEAEEEEEENTKVGEDNDVDVSTTVAVAGGAAAAGAATAAIAVSANKSNKKAKKKPKEKNEKNSKEKTSKTTTPEQPEDDVADVTEKNKKKPTIKAAVPVEETNEEPKKENPVANAARGNAPSRPEKASEKSENKPLSLKNMNANDMKSTIDALEEMVDNNLKSVIDNTKGKKTKSNESSEDKQLKNAVMNPAFQAEINSFLAQT